MLGLYLFFFVVATSQVCACVCVCAGLRTEAAEKLFDLVDSFAESAKRKAAVWPLQIILLILCPEITHTISKDTVEDSKANKVDGNKMLQMLTNLKAPYSQTVSSAVVSAETVSG